MQFDSVLEATEASIAAADHLTAADSGAVQALRELARQMDIPPLYVNKDGEEVYARMDNVTIPTFLRYCDALGLTPVGRKQLADKKQQAATKPNSLAERRAKHLRTA